MLLRLTVTGEVGAGLTVTVPVELLPPVTELGFKARLMTDWPDSFAAEITKHTNTKKLSLKHKGALVESMSAGAPNLRSSAIA